MCIGLLLLFPAALTAQNRQKIYGPLERGEIESNIRVGIWEYRDEPTEIALKVDYNQGKVLYVKPDTSVSLVKSGNEWIQTKLSFPCRFHGSMVWFYNHYRGIYWKLPEKVLKTERELHFWLTFEVGADGTASNPEVVNDPGYGTKEVLIETFQKAPNYWLAGIGPDKKAVACKLALEFRVCPGVCELPVRRTSELGKVVYSQVFFSKTPETIEPRKQRLNFLIRNESKGLQFSPDDKMLLLESALLGRSDGVTLLIPTDGETKLEIPFAPSKSAAWLDNDRLIFKFDCSEGLPTYLAVFDRMTGEVTNITDSTSYFHCAYPGSSNFAFLTASNEEVTIWRSDKDGKEIKPLIAKSRTAIVPENWSPGGKKMLLLCRDNDLYFYTVLDMSTKKQLIVPLYNSSFAGWHVEEDRLYLYKPVQGDYDQHGEIYEFNLTTETLTKIQEKTKRLWSARYSPVNHQMILNIGGDLFLQDMKNQTPMKRMPKANVRFYTWSNNGKKIAFLDGNEKRLYLYDVSSNQSLELPVK